MMMFLWINIIHSNRYTEGRRSLPLHGGTTFALSILLNVNKGAESIVQTEMKFEHNCSNNSLSVRNYFYEGHPLKAASARTSDLKKKWKLLLIRKRKTTSIKAYSSNLNQNWQYKMKNEISPEKLRNFIYQKGREMRHPDAQIRSEFFDWSDVKLVQHTSVLLLGSSEELLKKGAKQEARNPADAICKLTEDGAAELCWIEVSERLYPLHGATIVPALTLVKVYRLKSPTTFSEISRDHSWE